MTEQQSDNVVGASPQNAEFARANQTVENILESVSDAFFAVDHDWRFTYLNQQTEPILLRKREELIGRILWDEFPETVGSTFQRQYLKAVNEKVSVAFEEYFPPLTTWFEVRAYPSPQGLSVYFHDITARKRTEDALRASEEKYRMLFDSIDAGFCVLEIIFDTREKATDFRFVEINPAFARQTGLENAMGKTIREFAPNHEKFWFETYERIVLTGEPMRFQNYAAALGRWFDIYAFRVGEPHERRVAALFNDITAQKNVENRSNFVMRLDEAVRPLITPEEITVTLARLLGEHLGADRCAYAEVEADENHFVIPGDYTRDASVHSIVGRYALSDFGAEVLRLMRANEPYVVHDVNTDPQVTAVDLAAYRQTAIQAVICVPLHKNAVFTACMAVHQKTPRRWTPAEVELVGFVANRFWESIERARTVKQLHDSLGRETEARRQAETANRLKDEFLATVSHELRTPLNAILGWAHILQQSNARDENSINRALTIIERNARAQNQLIDDLLDVSRIITGKLRLDVRAVDLPGVIIAAVDAARPAAEAKNIRLQTLLDPQAGPISGDPDRLQQVVWNLLSNAIKFTPKDGRVQLRLERVNSHVEIIVSDTGKGIEPEFLPFVFDRFRQSDGSTSRRHGGLGLGLAIVRQLVELHGGTVSVTSRGENQGATFTVCLPLLPVRSEPANDAARVHPAAGNGRAADCPPELDGLNVLLVDDEADSRELLQMLLDGCGANVTAAESAAAALKLIERQRFDAIVSDIGMPEENGFSLIGKIRNLSNEAGGDTPAIALTAYARAEDRVEALRSGFQLHIAKPVDASELIVAVANLAGRMRNPIQSV